jgi:hypothetical protein
MCRVLTRLVAIGLGLATLGFPPSSAGADEAVIVGPQSTIALGGLFGRPALFDFDGDGDLDVFTPDELGDATLHLWDGARYTAAAVVELPPNHHNGPAVAGDIDGDGDLDLIQVVHRSDRSASTARVLLNDDGLLRPGKPVTPYGPPISGLELFDVDGDLDLDMIPQQIWRGEEAPRWFLNNNGVFQVEPVMSPRDDGLDRVVVIDPFTDTVKTGGQPYPQLTALTGKLRSDSAPPLLWAIQAATVADFDGDEAAEVLIARATNASTIETSNSGGALVTILWSPTTVSFSVPAEATKVRFFGLQGPQQADALRPEGDLATDSAITLDRDNPPVTPSDAPIRISLQDDAWLFEVTKMAVIFEFEEIGAARVHTETFDPISANVEQLLLQSLDGLDRTPASASLGLMQCRAAASGDFDNDGDIDGALGCGGPIRDGGVLLLENTDGVLSPRVLDEIVPAAHGFLIDDIAVGDVDMDGRLDMVITRADFYNKRGSVHLHRGVVGNGSTIDLGPQPVRVRTTALLSIGRVHTFTGLDGRVHVGGVDQHESNQLVFSVAGEILGATTTVTPGYHRIRTQDLEEKFRDLSIQLGTQPRVAHTADPVEVEVVVSNEGTALLNGLQLLASDPEGHQLGRTDIEPIQPGESQTVTVPLSFPTPGTVEWTVQVSASGLAKQSVSGEVVVVTDTVGGTGKSSPVVLGAGLGILATICALIAGARQRRNKAATS